MRFKPRIVTSENPSDDDDRSLQLPDDLQWLATELEQQAQHLADTYPPQPMEAVTRSESASDRDLASPGTARPSPTASRQRLWMRAFQAAAAVLILGAIWQQLSDRTTDRSKTTPPTEIVQHEPTSSDLPLFDPQVTGHAGWFSGWFSGKSVQGHWQDWPSPPSSPQLDHFPLLDEITGPELEGLIDLWEMQPTSKAMVAL